MEEVYFRYSTNLSDANWVTLREKAEIDQIIRVNKHNYKIIEVHQHGILVTPLSIQFNKDEKIYKINQVLYPI